MSNGYAYPKDAGVSGSMTFSAPIYFFCTLRNKGESSSYVALAFDEDKFIPSQDSYFPIIRYFVHRFICIQMTIWRDIINNLSKA